MMKRCNEPNRKTPVHLYVHLVSNLHIWSPANDVNLMCIRLKTITLACFAARTEEKTSKCTVEMEI